MKRNYFGKDWLKTIPKAALVMCSLLGVSGANAQISTFPWTEDFEDTSPTRESWTQIYEVNTMAWTFATSPSTGGFGSIVAHDGVKMANYPATSHNFDKTKLVSPVLDLSGVTNPTLEFYYRNPFWDPDQNWLRIFYRTSDASPWIQIMEYHEDVDAWTSSGVLELPTPSATYQIAVEVETDYGYSTTVDALVVNGEPLGVDERKMLSVGYYPNPAQDVLHFSSNQKVNELRVFTLLGQKVLETAVENNMGQIDVSSLSSGNYIVQAITANGTHAFKLAKK